VEFAEDLNLGLDSEDVRSPIIQQVSWIIDHQNLRYQNKDDLAVLMNKIHVCCFRDNPTFLSNLLLKVKAFESFQKTFLSLTRKTITPFIIVIFCFLIANLHHFFDSQRDFYYSLLSKGFRYIEIVWIFLIQTGILLSLSCLIGVFTLFVLGLGTNILSPLISAGLCLIPYQFSFIIQAGFLDLIITTLFFFVISAMAMIYPIIKILLKSDSIKRNGNEFLYEDHGHQNFMAKIVDMKSFNIKSKAVGLIIFGLFFCLQFLERKNIFSLSKSSDIIIFFLGKVITTLTPITPFILVFLLGNIILHLPKEIVIIKKNLHPKKADHLETFHFVSEKGKIQTILLISAMMTFVFIFFITLLEACTQICIIYSSFSITHREHSSPLSLLNYPLLLAYINYLFFIIMVGIIHFMSVFHLNSVVIFSELKRDLAYKFHKGFSKPTLEKELIRENLKNCTLCLIIGIIGILFVFPSTIDILSSFSIIFSEISNFYRFNYLFFSIGILSVFVVNFTISRILNSLLIRHFFSRREYIGIFRYENDVFR